MSGDRHDLVDDKMESLASTGSVSYMGVRNSYKQRAQHLRRLVGERVVA